MFDRLNLRRVVRWTVCRPTGNRVFGAGNVGPRLTLLLCAMMLGTAATSAADELTPRPEVIKPGKTEVDPVRFRTDVIAVKFQDGLLVRLRDHRLTDLGTGALRGAEAVLASVSDGRWERTHSVPEADLDRFRETAQDNLGKLVADLNLQFHLFLPKGANAGATIDALNALDSVEIALPVPIPIPAPIPPDYESMQGYLDPTTNGVDARCLWNLPGGDGTGVQIADVEYSLNFNHLDLPPVTLLGAAPNDPFNDNNHGTAVLGELGALNDGVGVTGIAHGGTFYFVAANTGPGIGVWDVGAAIITALGTLQPGDVCVVEQQMAGPLYNGNGQYGAVPIEWYLPWYNAVVIAVGQSVIVVEAAGNGSQDLDSPIYSTGNGGHWPFLPANDSGAIIVGAGAAPSGGSDVDRSRLWFSNYGSTVDLQAWGECVYTTGYGTIWWADGVNYYYTNVFGGTSAATPIVAGSCASMQGAHMAAIGTYLIPVQVKNALQSTGAPQQSGTFPATENIGPRPDAAAAICFLLPSLDSNGNLIPDACEQGQGGELFEFSLDIGSDTELSDPFRDGDEGFDPGDVYLSQSAPVIPPGRDGFKDDLVIFNFDPWPDPPDPGYGTAVPVGSGSLQDYLNYFDLDGHDQLDVSLFETEWIPYEYPVEMPIPEFASACIYGPEFLVISFDDDMGPGWPMGDVPVSAPSPAGVTSYGSAVGQDEIIGLILTVPGGPPPYPLQQIYPVMDEVGLHPSLAPDPDNVIEDEDDDVDSLDIVADCEECVHWYFTADHEAHLGLDPGDIYQVTPWGPFRLIDDVIHLGIPDETDVDAFEFVWLENPMDPSTRCLALLYSVDDDDPVTPWDESGGLDPTMIFGSYLAGFSFPVTDPLGDDVDALTSWYRPFEPQPQTGACCLADCNCAVLTQTDCANAGGVWAGPGTDCSDNDGDGIADMCFTCVGDLNCDGNVDLNDLAQLLSNYGQTSGVGWREGDFDGDGDVDLSDLALLLARYGGC
jgi:serine protease